MSDSIMDDAEVVQTNEAYDCLGARIKVIGVGGGGGNAVQHMIDSGLPGVEFVCANTDKQALNKSTAENKIQLGEKLTRGRGAGANPKIGREAAMESINAIRDSIGDAEMLFVTAGMGGGTGTGGAAVVAQVAREMNVLTVGVVTKPFSFEGPKRKKAADEGLSELKQYVDCLITIPNDRLIGLAPKKASFIDMLQRSNEVLYHAVKGISDVVNGEGMINLDFADVRTTMQEAGLALMGTGVGTGENRARDASQKAISSPLLEDVSLDSAKAILYNITGPRDITIAEVNEIGSMIREAAPEDCNIIFGVVFDDNIGDDLYVTLIATGIEPEEHESLDGESMVSRGAHITDLRKIQQAQDLEAPVSKPIVTNRPPQRRRSVSLENPIQQDVQVEDGQVDYQEKPSWYSGSRRQSRRSQHTPGMDTYTFDEDTSQNYELPTFIRHQAN
ncbi:MAG: cell division protein FtsZ [Desulfovibrio sp.]|nr:cell division protein FtsZ [Desulfovibrio sp.]